MSTSSPSAIHFDMLERKSSQTLRGVPTLTLEFNLLQGFHGYERRLLRQNEQSEDSEGISNVDPNERRSVWMRFLGLESDSYRQAYNIAPQMRKVAC
jgi:hypothetical protein